jgi:hypothetical protein
VRARVVVLEVAQDRLGAGRLQVVRVGGVADQAARPVAGLGEQSLEPQRDLAVASGDQDLHVGGG